MNEKQAFGYFAYFDGELEFADLPDDRDVWCGWSNALNEVMFPGMSELVNVRGKIVPAFYLGVIDDEPTRMSQSAAISWQKKAEVELFRQLLGEAT